MAKSKRTEAVQITNPDRLVYPNHRLTKRDLISYYERMAPYILPHLRNRPVTLKRYTDTTTGPWFYEKDAPAFTPSWVETFPVWRRSGESQIHYIIISDERTLLWAANVGTIEIHPFLARKPDINMPQFIVFDLDPGEGANILTCGRVALLLHSLLNELELQSCAKVSGSKGLQVYVPLNSPTAYSITQPFAKTVSELLYTQHPDLVVAEMQRSERKGKVFIDWSQNADFKTTIGVYSLRAKRHRPFVSLPITWDELKAALEGGESSALYWLADAAVERVQTLGDLFAPVLTLQQSLPETFIEKLAVLQPSSTLPAKHRPSPAQSPKPALPRASSQGGRRRFLLQTPHPDNASKNVKSLNNPAALELALENGERWLCWSFESGLPTATQIAPATESSFCISDEQFDSILRDARHSRHEHLPKGVVDLGSYELVEGDPARGYAHLFFSGRELTGDFFVVRSSAEPALWSASRKPQPYPNAGISAPQERSRH